MSFLDLRTGVIEFLCIKCHRTCDITIPLWRKVWGSTVKFCPFCAEPYTFTDEQLRAAGYLEASK